MRELKLIGVLLLALAVMGCTTTAGFKKASRAAKLTAEEAFDLIYTAYLHKQVKHDDFMVADRLYDDYEETQGKIAKALTANDLDEATRLISASQAIADKLIDLVFRYGLEVE